MRLEGSIVAAGFASGDRFVVGRWLRGPLGPMTDVMWATPEGRKILLADAPAVARFVGGVYSFDHVEVCPMAVSSAGAHTIAVETPRVRLTFVGGRPHPLFALRPKALRRSALWVRVEDTLLRPLVGRLALRGAPGARAYGRSASGVREWYCIDAYRPLVAARGSVDGRDLGPLHDLDPPAHFGFSEFPRRPAMVACAPLLEGAGPWLASDLSSPEAGAPASDGEPPPPPRSSPG